MKKRKGLAIRISLVTYDKDGAEKEIPIKEEKLQPKSKAVVDSGITSAAVNRGGQKQ